jgi:hypothetical protein
MRAHHTPPQAWAQHLAGPPAGAGPSPGIPLTMAEAARVQRYRDQLMAALRAQDRPALRSAKQQVLEAAFGPGGTGPAGPAAESPALRRALRDLSWRMTAVLLVRGAHR